MGADAKRAGTSMTTFLAHFLFILAAWTLVIKFVFPVSFALWQGEPVITHIYWDFWWVIHIWLGWSLLRWQRYTYALAVAVSLVEIVIIVTKFLLFLDAPEWTIWSTNWFVNKVFVLACFCWMLGYFVVRRRRLLPSRAAPMDYPATVSRT